YNFQWQMVQEGVEWFGDISPNVSVTVSSSAPTCDCPTYPTGYANYGGGVYCQANAGTCATTSRCYVASCTWSDTGAFCASSGQCVPDATCTPAPVLTSATSAAATVGLAFSYQITATNSPTSYDATGLPA